MLVWIKQLLIQAGDCPAPLRPEYPQGRAGMRAFSGSEPANAARRGGHDHDARRPRDPAARGAVRAAHPPGQGYKWIALSNTTLGVLMATINASIMLIALPDIFRGIGVNPLQPGNTSLLLWMIMGYLVVTAVLVVSFGRLGDMFGRVRIYNLGFAVFSVFSVLLALTWLATARPRPGGSSRAASCRASAGPC